MANNRAFIIGIDHGNGFMKTASAVFRSGVDTYRVQPPMEDGVLRYDNVYHVIGENRKSYDPDKTKTQDFYCLTLAAVAMEIEKRRYPRSGCTFILACGLPIEFFGKQKDSFKDYLQQKREISFRFGAHDYQFKIKKVYIFPQGYAAIAPQIASYSGRVNIIDIGSGTVDVLQLINKKPVLTKCISLPLGILSCIDDIQKYVRMEYGMELDDYSIQEVLQMRDGDLPDELQEVIRQHIRDYIQKVIAALEQKGISFQLQKCHFCCGGSLVFKNYGEFKSKNITFDTDIHANAKGFEFLCKGIEKQAEKSE